MKQNVLFLSEKWCDAKPELGWTNSFHNFFNTFAKTQPHYIFNTLHLDEASVVFEKHIDEVLLNYCSKFKVDIIICCLLGNSAMNPSKEVFRKLKGMGKYICILWPDTGISWGLQTIKDLGELINLHVSIDYPLGPHINNYTQPKNHLFLWTPEDEHLYFKQQQDIDISFVGSKTYYDRRNFLMALRNEFPNMYIGGGQREEGLSPEKYAEIVRRSKIGLNFSLSPTMVFHQLKGRTLEYLASGSLLIENSNPSTEQFFTPNIDYVNFTTYPELSEKIRYYLSHDEERIKIAEQGYNTFITKWSAKIFWDTVMNHIAKDRS